MKELNNIENYRLYSDKLYYYNNDKSNILNIMEGDKITRNIKVDGTSHWLFQDENYIRNFQGQCFCIRDNYLELLKYDYIQAISNIGVSIDYTHYNGRKQHETLFKLPEEKQILSEWLPNRIFHIQDQYWVNDTEEDFKLIDAEKGKILWTIPQPDVEKPYGYNGLTNIKKVLGIYKGNLWLQLPDSRFLVLDIIDGSIKHELKHDYYIVHERGTFFDREEGIIKVLYYNLYAKYSLDLKQFVEEVDLGVPEIFQVTSMISRQKDKYIYYTAKLNDVSMISNAYGIFDTEKKEVIFQGEEIEVDGHFYQEPQVNDELFTILDNKGNLIIHQMRDIIGGEK